MSGGRDFVVVRQEVSLRVDIPQRRILGHALLRFQSTSSEGCRRIRFHMRCGVLTSVKLNGEVYEDYEYLDEDARGLPSLEAFGTERSLSVYSNTYKSFCDTSLLGNMTINVPSQEIHEVEVEYELQNPNGGVLFSRGNNIMFTDDQPLSVQFWAPVLADTSVVSSFYFTIACDESCTVICSGQLSQTQKSHDRNIFFFSQDFPVCSSSLFLSVGQFVRSEINSLPYVSVFSMEKYREMAIHTSSYLNEIIEYMEEFLSVSIEDLFPELSVVFLPNLATDYQSHVGVICLSDRLLHEERDIDAEMKARMVISLAVCRMIVRTSFVLNSWQDIWLEFGLSHVLRDVYCEYRLGKCSVDIQRFIEMQELTDVIGVKQVLQRQCGHPAELITEMREKRAAVLMFVVRRAGSEKFREFIVKSVSDAVSSCDCGYASSCRILSTKDFFRSLDMEKYAKWVEISSIPSFECTYTFDGKKKVEMGVRQMGDCYQGVLPLVSYERGGQKGHVIQLQDEFSCIDFKLQLHGRRGRRRKYGQKSGFDEDDDDDEFDAEEVPLEFDTGAPLRYIRVDPGLEWLRRVIMVQSEEMWIAQMQERDVISEYEVIEAFSNMKLSPRAVAALYKCLRDESRFWRIRVAAAYGLSKLACSETKWRSMDVLVDYVKSALFDKNTGTVLPNNFSNVGRYFVLKELPMALARIRNDDGITPTVILEVLLDMLEQNDNRLNYFNDDEYVAAIITAVGECHAATAELVNTAKTQLRRYLVKDRCLPSRNLVVTYASIRAIPRICILENPVYSPVEKDIEMGDYLDRDVSPLAVVGNDDVVRIASCSVLMDMSPDLDVTFCFVLNGTVRESQGYIRNSLMKILNNPQREGRGVDYFESVRSWDPENLRSLQSGDKRYRNDIIESISSVKRFVNSLFSLCLLEDVEADPRFGGLCVSLYSLFFSTLQPPSFPRSQFVRHFSLASANRTISVKKLVKNVGVKRKNDYSGQLSSVMRPGKLKKQWMLGSIDSGIPCNPIPASTAESTRVTVRHAFAPVVWMFVGDGLEPVVVRLREEFSISQTLWKICPLFVLLQDHDNKAKRIAFDHVPQDMDGDLAKKKGKRGDVVFWGKGREINIIYASEMNLLDNCPAFGKIDCKNDSNRTFFENVMRSSPKSCSSYLRRPNYVRIVAKRSRLVIEIELLWTKNATCVYDRLVRRRLVQCMQLSRLSATLVYFQLPVMGIEYRSSTHVTRILEEGDVAFWNNNGVPCLVLARSTSKKVSGPFEVGSECEVIGRVVSSFDDLPLLTFGEEVRMFRPMKHMVIRVSDGSGITVLVEIFDCYVGRKILERLPVSDLELVTFVGEKSRAADGTFVYFALNDEKGCVEVEDSTLMRGTLRAGEVALWNNKKFDQAQILMAFSYNPEHTKAILLAGSEVCTVFGRIVGDGTELGRIDTCTADAQEVVAGSDE